jgi:hypothetical protein
MSAKNKKLLWTAGRALDTAHMPLAIAVLLLGRFWMPLWLWVGTVAVITTLQVAVLGCPLMVLTHWLKHWYDPKQPSYGAGSLTYMLYRRYGRCVGVLIFIALLTLGIVIRYLASK